MQIGTSIVVSIMALAVYFLWPFIDSSRPKLDALERAYLPFMTPIQP